MATRHHARQGVISLLYAYDLNGKNVGFVDEFLEEKKIRNEQRKFTLDTYNGVCLHLVKLDEEIQKYLKEADKVGKVEMAILRLSSYEILFTNIDKAIVINEAIELAKEFTNESSAKFINGVLDCISRIKI